MGDYADGISDKEQAELARIVDEHIVKCLMDRSRKTVTTKQLLKDKPIIDNKTLEEVLWVLYNRCGEKTYKKLREELYEVFDVAYEREYYIEETMAAGGWEYVRDTELDEYVNNQVYSRFMRERRPHVIRYFQDSEAGKADISKGFRFFYYEGDRL